MLAPRPTDRTVLQSLFGWHPVPWMDAFCVALGGLSRHPGSVLEIGASRHSAPSLFFLRQGASVDVTCYEEAELPALKRFCERSCSAHGLRTPTVHTLDVFAEGPRRYDLVLLRGVLGGLDRGHDLGVFSRAVQRSMERLTPGGHLIILDKGWCSPIHERLLRKFGGAGRNNWHYFRESELRRLLLTGRQPELVWKGFLSLGVMPSPLLQRLADALDQRLFNARLRHRGTVFAATFRSDGAAGVAATG
jgi:hypothetical protein